LEEELQVVLAVAVPVLAGMGLVLQEMVTVGGQEMFTCAMPV
jgi:hypothetical protein